MILDTVARDAAMASAAWENAELRRERVAMRRRLRVARVVATLAGLAMIATTAAMVAIVYRAS